MPPDLKKLCELSKEWQEQMALHGGWNAVFWCNHDQPRIVSRFGDEGRYWKHSAKMLGTFVHMLRGTPYIYQGEELGMTNAHFKNIEDYNDVEAINYYGIMLENGRTKDEALKVLSQRARDNGRTPMQWNSGKNGGFSGGKAWLGLPDNYGVINVESEEADKDSILNYYRQLVRLRKEYRVISDGAIKFLDTGNEKVLSYERTLGNESLIVICNFSNSDEHVNIVSEGSKILGNYADVQPDGKILRPYEALVIRKS